VDVNQGWKDENAVVEMIAWMKDQNVVLVEQPMPVICVEEMKRVKKKSVLPLIADESVQRLKDIDHAAAGFHGINIKLMKSTGLMEADAMIHHGKKTGMQIYLGCMGESSCATTAMSHLLAHADYVDLDAPLLIVNDPFQGIQYENGQVQPAKLPGTGASTSLQF
jgi:L-Ala-D/L-Glu epimerase